MDHEHILSIIAIVISVFGIVYTRLNYNKTKKMLLNEAIGKLYQQNNEIRKIFLDKPNLRIYFYDNKAISPDDPDYNIVLSIAEIILNYLEHLYIQRKNIDKKDWEQWSKAVHMYYSGSPTIRDIANKSSSVCLTSELQEELNIASAFHSSGS